MTLSVDGSVERQYCAISCLWSHGDSRTQRTWEVDMWEWEPCLAFAVSRFPSLDRDDKFPSALIPFGCVKISR